MIPTTSLWYSLYLQGPLTRKRDLKLFRQRFRISYNDFKRLHNDLKSHDLFQRWCNTDCVGDKSVPLELLLLFFFRYVGRGFTFDDLEECTAISAETHRQFMLEFIQYGSSFLWDQYVIKTESSEDAAYNSCLFESAGFPGCIGSVDGTHVLLEKCPYWAQNKHKGYKLNKPSRN